MPVGPIMAPILVNRFNELTYVNPPSRSRHGDWAEHIPLGMVVMFVVATFV